MKFYIKLINQTIYYRAVHGRKYYEIYCTKPHGRTKKKIKMNHDN